MRVFLAILVWFSTIAPAAAETATADNVSTGVERIERLLSEWQFLEARDLAQALLSEHPDLPAVQFAAAWVKFHLAEHQAALTLAERAAVAFAGRMDRDPRLGLIRSTAGVASGFTRESSQDGRVVVFRRPGPDEILVPYIVEAVEQTIQVVGEDLGHKPDHPILVEIVPDAEALGAMTGLTADEIRTSGTIAVCKYGRLLITSPRATLKGFGWLDTASHELVHMIISEKTHNRVPIWLHEALARFEDTRWRADEPLYRKGLHPVSESNLARAMAKGALITFEQMHPSMALLPSKEAAALAFSEVYTVADFLVQHKGYAGIRGLLERMRDGAKDMEAIRAVYGWQREAFVEAWLAWLTRQRLRKLRGEAIVMERKPDPPGKSRYERALTDQKRVDLRDFFHLGQLLRARNRTGASVVEYKKAVGRAGSNHAALWILSDKLGLALLGLDRGPEAREAFEASLEINPQDLEAHLHLGHIRLADDPHRAWLHLRECMRINPIDPRVHRLAYRAAKKLSEDGDTREDWALHRDRHQQALRLLAGAPDEPAPAAAERGEKDSAEPTAFLKIHAVPWSRVWLDYRDTGLTTPVYRLPVAPGSHVVGLVAACRSEPLVVQVRLTAGETAVIDEVLCSEPAEAKATVAE